MRLFCGLYIKKKFMSYLRKNTEFSFFHGFKKGFK